MQINQLRHQIDRDHAYREENPHCIGIPQRSRIPKHRFSIKYAGDRDTAQEGTNTMAKSVEGKNKAAEAKAAKATPAKKETWGSKEMAAALKIEPKRLRTILRAAGKGVSGDGEVGRYEWKPNDQDAIKKIGKMVAEYEAKAAAKKEAADKPAKKTAKKAAAPAAKKTAKKSTPPPVEEESAEEEVFEEGEEEEEEVEA